MQNRTDSGTPRFSTPPTTWRVPLHNIAIKVAKCTKYEIKALFLQISGLYPIF